MDRALISANLMMSVQLSNAGKKGFHRFLFTENMDVCRAQRFCRFG